MLASSSIHNFACFCESSPEKCAYFMILITNREAKFDSYETLENLICNGGERGGKLIRREEGEDDEWMGRKCFLFNRPFIPLG